MALHKFKIGREEMARVQDARPANVRLGGISHQRSESARFPKLQTHILDIRMWLRRDHEVLQAEEDLKKRKQGFDENKASIQDFKAFDVRDQFRFREDVDVDGLREQQNMLSSNLSQRDFHLLENIFQEEDMEHVLKMLEEKMKQNKLDDLLKLLHIFFSWNKSSRECWLTDEIQALCNSPASRGRSNFGESSTCHADMESLEFVTSVDSPGNRWKPVADNVTATFMDLLLQENEGGTPPPPTPAVNKNVTVEKDELYPLRRLHAIPEKDEEGHDKPRTEAAPGSSEESENEAPEEDMILHTTAKFLQPDENFPEKCVEKPLGKSTDALLEDALIMCTNAQFLEPEPDAKTLENSIEASASKKSVDELSEEEENEKFSESDEEDQDQGNGEPIEENVVVCGNVKFLYPKEPTTLPIHTWKENKKSKVFHFELGDPDAKGKQPADTIVHNLDLNGSESSSGGYLWDNEVFDYIRTGDILPPFLTTMCLIQIIIFYAGNANVHWYLIFHPYRRYEAWRFLTSFLIHCKDRPEGSSDYPDLRLWITVGIQFVVANFVERKVGSLRTVTVYFGSAVCGTLLASVASPRVFANGASDAIAGTWMSLISYSILTATKGNYWLTWLRILICVVTLAFLKIIPALYYDEPLLFCKMDLGGVFGGIMFGLLCYYEPEPRRFWKRCLKIFACILIIAYVAAAAYENVYYQNTFKDMQRYDYGMKNLVQDLDSPNFVYSICANTYAPELFVHNSTRK